MTKHQRFQTVIVYVAWQKYILSKHVNPNARRVSESCIWMKIRSTGAIIRNVLKSRRNTLNRHPFLVSLTTLSHCAFRCSVSLNSKKIKSGARVFGVSKSSEKWFCLSTGTKIGEFLGKGGGGTLPSLAGHEGSHKAQETLNSFIPTPIRIPDSPTCVNYGINNLVLVL